MLEDLGVSQRLDQVLIGDDPNSAEAMLNALAATLGRMHAITIGNRAEFERISSNLLPRVNSVHSDRSGWFIGAARSMARGVAVRRS